MFESLIEKAPQTLPREGLAQALRFNEECICHCLDPVRMSRALAVPGFAHEALRETHPHLFSDTRVYVAEAQLRFMARLVAAVERLVQLPAWHERILTHAPAAAHHVPAAAGVFLGYDFHLNGEYPQLIEINTNAGGGLLNAKLLQAQQVDCEHALKGFPEACAVEADFVAMFREEWRLSRGARPLKCIAIVDESPENQFLAPEFVFFQRLFESVGIAALIVDPRELRLEGGELRCGERTVDLVYNRLTDFSLDAPPNAVLQQAWLEDAVVLTPHPRAHAVYADKRNLVALSDADWLREIGVAAEDRQVLQAGVPRTVEVTPENADRFWAARRQWFFKPAVGYGGKAAYRGDKLTRRVFSEIIQGRYIAQALVPPSERCVRVDGEVRRLKLDVRNFVYQGCVQLVSARLYQGQTTNFRTHGGGFAAVLAV